MGNTDSTLNSDHSETTFLSDSHSGTGSSNNNKSKTNKFDQGCTVPTSIHDDYFTAYGYRTLRRSRLTRRALVLHQISKGRANPSEAWCNNRNCTKELIVFSNPFVYLIDFQNSREGLPVAVYFKDFANAMITQFFDIEDTNTKEHKTRGLLSFIDSPPVRAAFWRFIGSYERLNYRLSDEDFQKALMKARPVFLDTMFGIKTAARARKVHSYINPEPEDYDNWDLQQLILRFLICCEVWRQQKTPRSENWKIGSREGVGHFMTAMLFHYRLMWRQNCFYTDLVHTNHVWDRVWDLWLQRYPLEEPNEVVDGDIFQIRDHLEKTEQEVLDEVGYLGGIGQNDESYNPVQWYLGNEELFAMSE